MRSSGGCTIQQALTAEAASVVNQAINLARRRGHAQVTPLHVASTMLSSSSGLLRTACLQSHSHPLQCRALELCFNVALNRLPTSTASSTSPMLMGAINPSSHSHRPAISNALVAAFKRAQAHQRRGSVENQQQPILVVKIDLQQLIISILDDPSVSRVMKEAGFSSPLVKDKVEQSQVSSSKDVHNSNKDDYDDSSINKKKPPPPPPPPPKVDHTNNSMDDDDSNTPSRQQHDHHELGSSTLGFGLVQQEAVKQRRKISDDQSVIIRKEDIKSLIDSLMMRNNKRSKRSHVVVGECVATLEGVVRGAKDQLEKGARPLSSPSSSSTSYDENDHHHHGSNCAVKFVPVSLHSFVHLTRQQVEQQILQLKCLVNKCRTEENNRVVLYLGDLKWCIDFRADSSINYKNYCPVEHMIVELGRLVSDYYDSGRLWLIGIATFQTYTRCKTASTRSGQYSSLETIWGLHPITIPSGSLALSLFPADSSSDIQSPSVNKKGGDHGGSNCLLVDNSSIGGNQDKSVGGATCLLDGVMTTTTPIMCTETPTSSPRLPSWLQQCKGDINSLINANQDPAVPAAQVCKRWNSFNGGGGHHEATTSQSSFERTLSFSSISPLNSSPSYDHQHPFFKLQHQHRHLQEPNNFNTNNSFFCISNYDVPPSSTSNRSSDPPTTVLTMHIHQQDGAVQRQRGFISSSISPNDSTPNSATCSSDMIIMECSPPSPRFKKYNVTNLDTLCRALEEKVPRQKDIIPEIASTVLHCRSGTGRRRSSGSNHVGLPNHHHHQHRNNKKEETWFLFQGLDVDAKVKIAEELARLVFGSQDKFVSIPLSSLSSPSTRTSEFLEDHNSSCSPTKPSVRSKRLRDEQSCRICIERFAEAMSSDPNRVFFVEGVDQVDYCSQMDLKKAIERGKLTNRNDEEVGLGDAIVILSCESCFISPRSRDCSPCFKLRHDIMDLQTKAGICVCDGLEEERSANNYSSPSFSLDLNISIDDDQEEVDHHTSTVDNVGLVASVDRCVMFKI